MRSAFFMPGVICLATCCGCWESSPLKPINSGPSEDEVSQTKLVTLQTKPAEATSKPAEATFSTADAKSRKFTFHYRFRVKDLKPADDAEKPEIVRVWFPCPASNDCQQITRGDGIAPAELSEATESRYGNRILYFETPIPTSGELSVDIPYDVVRHEAISRANGNGSSETGKNIQLELFLSADRLVPTTGKFLDLLGEVAITKDGLGLGRQLYDIVDEHVTYKKEGTGWGRGDTNWVCDSRYGNCTDFHSLFISLARSQGLPARFEIGFSIPTDKTEGLVTGYHCWAWFYVKERGWIPVDISEADKMPAMKEYYFGNLTADRVMFSVGRDLELVPKSDDQPLNFFIFPHIEVGGNTLPASNIEMQCQFKEQQ